MSEANRLFPIFLKMEQLRLLIVGGGAVGLEKLRAVLAQSPATSIRLVGITVCSEIKDLAEGYSNLQWEERPFQTSDLEEADIVIIAVDNKATSRKIRQETKGQGRLVNVADTPDLCDFYLGSIVTKGNLKLAISTNGQSPTLAKRLRAVLDDALPEEIDELLTHLHQIRSRLKGDFASKVHQLNELTQGLL